MTLGMVIYVMDAPQINFQKMHGVKGDIKWSDFVFLSWGWKSLHPALKIRKSLRYIHDAH